VPSAAMAIFRRERTASVVNAVPGRMIRVFAGSVTALKAPSDWSTRCCRFDAPQVPAIAFGTAKLVADPVGSISNCPIGRSHPARRTAAEIIVKDFINFSKFRYNEQH